MKQAKFKGLSLTLVILSLIFFLFFVKDSSASTFYEDFISSSYKIINPNTGYRNLINLTTNNLNESFTSSYNTIYFGHNGYLPSSGAYFNMNVAEFTQDNVLPNQFFFTTSLKQAIRIPVNNIRINNNSIITLKGKMLQKSSEASSFKCEVVFINDSGCVATIGWNESTLVNTYFCNSVPKYRPYSDSFQFGTVLNQTGNSLYSKTGVNLTGITELALVCSGSGGGYTEITNFTITDVENYVSFTGNNLPNVTLNYNTSLFCFNESKGYVDFKFDLDAVDPESDTIYYSTQQNNVLNNSYVLDFTNHYCVLGLCADYKDTSFLNDLIESNFTDDSFLVYDLYTGMEPNDYELIFYDNMVFNYELENALLNLNSIVEFGNLFDGAHFNISYTDSTLENDFMNLYVIRNVSNIDVMVQDTVVFTFGYNTTTNYLNIFYYNNSLFYVANDNINSGLIAWELEENTPTVISIDSQDIVDTDNSFRLRSIEYFGNSFDFEWTTSLPTNKIYWDVGEYVYDVYVTDDVHKDVPDYVHKSVYVKVVDEKQCIEPYGQTNLITQITSKTVGQFIKDMGIGNTVESMLSLAYLICLVLGFIVLGSFSTSFFLTNLSFFLISLLLGLSFGPLIIFSVLLAISTMNFFKEVF